jgi:hypothetical protein
MRTVAQWMEYFDAENLYTLDETDGLFAYAQAGIHGEARMEYVVQGEGDNRQSAANDHQNAE